MARCVADKGAAGMAATRDAALRWLRTRRSLLLACLLAAIALEAIGFNHYTWSTMGYRPIANPAISVSDGKSAYGDSHDAISDGITIDIYPGGDASTYVDVRSLRLDMSLGRACRRRTCTDCPRNPDPPAPCTR